MPGRATDVMAAPVDLPGDGAAITRRGVGDDPRDHRGGDRRGGGSLSTTLKSSRAREGSDPGWGGTPKRLGMGTAGEVDFRVYGSGRTAFRSRSHLV